jgi:signal transduction histidine kinase
MRKSACVLMSTDLDFQALFEALPNVLLVVAADDDFTMLAASEGRIRATNVSREASIGRPLFDVFGKNPNDDADFGVEVLRASLQRVLKTKASDRMAVTKYDIPRPEADGGGFEERYWSPLNTPVFNEHGEVRYIIHQVEDVTEQIQEQQEVYAELRASDERLRAALLASGTGTFHWSLRDSHFYVDNALSRLLNIHEGHTVATLEQFLAYIHPEDCERVRQAFAECGKGIDLRVEFRLKQVGLDETWLSARGKVLLDPQDQPSHMVGACTDISARKHAEIELHESERSLRSLNETLEARIEQEVTERSRTEEALRQSQKMEAVGQLTGGIAHDFNNLLAGIIGSLEFIQNRLATGRNEGLSRYTEAAMLSANRAASLTQRLLAFSRRQTLDPKPIEPNRLVVDMEDMIRRSVGPAVKMEAKLAERLPRTLCDPNQLENALLNIAINARDAMPDGGRLTFTTALALPQELAACGLTSDGDGFINISITDTGTGMTPEALTRAFEPFYTTKPLGQGTGLGLSMVYGFVQQSGGHACIQSELGRGTTVCLYLPIYTREVKPEKMPEVPSPRPVASQEQTILVVDDESVVRMLIVDMLSELGYRTVESDDGVSGLALLETMPDVDLLITDVGLPGGMNGRQFADLARQHKPGLNVLFVTGYAENDVVSGCSLEPGMQVLTKPFSMSDLALRIESLLKR